VAPRNASDYRGPAWEAGRIRSDEAYVTASSKNFVDGPEMFVRFRTEEENRAASFDSSRGRREFIEQAKARARGR
jgi:hypothetical protein